MWRISSICETGVWEESCDKRVLYYVFMCVSHSYFMVQHLLYDFASNVILKMRKGETMCPPKSRGVSSICESIDSGWLLNMAAEIASLINAWDVTNALTALQTLSMCWTYKFIIVVFVHMAHKLVLASHLVQKSHFINIVSCSTHGCVKMYLKGYV